MYRVVRRLFALAYRTIWNTLRVRFAHNQRNRYFKFRSSGTPAGVPLLLFSQVGSLQRHFLRKRSAAGIPGHHFTKQKSHRFCISASTMASYWSGRRGSNSLPPPWQGGALPDELRPHIRCIYPCTLPFFNGAFAMNCVKKEKVLHDFRRGASDRNRTNDTGIFSPLLYRLSYRGKYDPDRARTDDPQRDRLVL